MDSSVQVVEIAALTASLTEAAEAFDKSTPSVKDAFPYSQFVVVAVTLVKYLRDNLPSLRHTEPLVTLADKLLQIGQAHLRLTAKTARWGQQNEDIATMFRLQAESLMAALLLRVKDRAALEARRADIKNQLGQLILGLGVIAPQLCEAVRAGDADARKGKVVEFLKLLQVMIKPPPWLTLSSLRLICSLSSLSVGYCESQRGQAL